MPRATHVQTNFTAGEISPRLLGRSDLTRYQNGLQTANNVIIYPHGMIARRPGTKYVSTTKNSSSARLIPFKYNDDQAYAIEFGDQYLRFYRDDGQVEATGTNTITNASWSVGQLTFTASGHTIGTGDIVTTSGFDDAGFNVNGRVVSTTSNQFVIEAADPGVSYAGINISTASWSAGTVTYTTAAVHGLTAGDTVEVAGVTPSGYDFVGTVTGTPSTTTFEVSITSDPGSYSSGGVLHKGVTDSPYQVPSPWSASEAEEISYVQSADILYCFHPNFAPRQIARTGADVFTVSTFEIKNGPFEAISQTAKLTVSATAHDATAVDSTEYRAGAAANDWAGDEVGEHLSIQITGDGFAWDHDGANGTTGTHIGRLIKFKWDEEDYYVALIYQTISTTEAYAIVLEKGADITTSEDIDPETVDNDQWFLGDFYGSFEDSTHRRALITGVTYAATESTVTCARKHTLQAGDSVDIEFLESTTDINGTYTVLGTGLTDTAFEITTADPGTVTSNTGAAVVPEFLSNTTQEGTANDMNQPAVPAFYQQRMWLGRTTQNVNRIYGSVTGDFDNFQESSLLASESYATLDTDALNLTIDDDQVNEIRWIRSVARGLIIGTNGAEYALTGSQTSSVITPSNVQAQRQTEYGSALNIRPELIGRSLLFAHRSSTRLVELSYSFEADQQVGSDVSIVSEHLLKPGIKAMAFAEVPVRTLWMAMNDGSCVTFVFEKEQDVLGWTKCEFGGGGLAESVVALPESNEDAIWFVVNRDGTRTIEVMKPPYDTDSNQVDAWYVDNGLAFDQTNTDAADTLTFTASTYETGDTGTLTASGHTPFAGTSSDLGVRYRLFNGTDWYDLEITVADTTTSCTAKVMTSGYPTALQATATSSWARLTDTFSGLLHLAGETVSVFSDGGTHEDVVVDSSGGITLNNLACQGVVGHGYTTTIKSLPVRVLQYFTETRGKVKSMYAVEMQLWESLGGEVDFGDEPEDIEYRDNESALGQAPDLFTGIVEMAPGHFYDSQSSVRITNAEPTPFNLLSVVYEMDINEPI